MYERMSTADETVAAGERSALSFSALNPHSPTHAVSQQIITGERKRIRGILEQLLVLLE